jgi:hypothetical protein
VLLLGLLLRQLEVEQAARLLDPDRIEVLFDERAFVVPSISAPVASMAE